MNKTPEEMADELGMMWDQCAELKEQLEAERKQAEALAAHVEMLTEKASYIGEMSHEDAVAMMRDVTSQSPETNLAQRDARVAAEAWKNGFISACVYAAGMLYSWESTGTLEMLRSAVTDDELHLGSEYDLKRLIESGAAGNIPGLHKAWQIARRRESAEIAAGGESWTS